MQPEARRESVTLARAKLANLLVGCKTSCGQVDLLSLVHLTFLMFLRMRATTADTGPEKR